MFNNAVSCDTVSTKSTTNNKGNYMPHNDINAGSLRRDLSERHIRMIALGACIGISLFYGSAKTIQMAGPAIMLSYFIAGLAILVIMRALGEMAVHSPVAGSFSQYAHEYFGPLAGYLTGWNYWFFWVVTLIAEISVVGIYMGYWFPDIPQWIWALAALGGMTAINLAAVKAFGEFEFWFSLIKIVTIIAMIIGGLGIILFGFGNNGIAVGISNLWAHGGFMPNGIEGLLMSLQLAVFGYTGVELIGLAAGEAKNPTKTIPKATNSVFWRILIFYVGALFIILTITPWNQLSTKVSPFVMTFELLGIKTAAGIVNFVLITAALSSANSGIFSTGRMLYGMAQKGHALKRFGRVSRRSGIPYHAVLFTVAVLLIGVLLNYVMPEDVFSVMTAIATFCAVWTWSIILLSQIRFRRSLTPEQQAKLSFRMWLWPLSSYLALAFLAFVMVVMAWFETTRIALYAGVLFLAGLTMIYMLRLKNAQDSENVVQDSELTSVAVKE